MSTPIPITTKTDTKIWAHQGEPPIQNSAAIGNEMPHQNSAKTQSTRWLRLAELRATAASNTPPSRPDSARQNTHKAPSQRP
ncbi:hypothetical protein Y695_04521 [Hydrogenophaga sp. T4]|nr:hypothetical protein Y695_04521 [Hydrogenophaga sp. T4]